MKARRVSEGFKRQLEQKAAKIAKKDKRRDSTEANEGNEVREASFWEGEAPAEPLQEQTLLVELTAQK